MVRRAVGIWVAVLREVVGPVTWMHGWIPVHPGAGSSLVVLQRVVRMPILPAGSEGRWRRGVKLHFRMDFLGVAALEMSWLVALHQTNEI